MKIVQIVHDFPPKNIAGTEIHTLNLSKELSDKHEVWVLCREFGHFNQEFKITDEVYEGLNVRRVFYNGDENILSSLKNKHIEDTFDNLLSVVKPDIVHIQHLLWLSASIISLAKKRNIPVLVTLHDYWYICPLVTLINSSGDICSGPDSGAKCFGCRDCFVNIIPKRGIATREKGTGLDNIMTKVKCFVPVFLWRTFQTGLDKVTKPSRSEQLDEKSLIHRKSSAIEILNHADMILSPSDFVKDKYIEYGLIDEKIILMEEGVILDWLKDVNKPKSKPIRFGYVGTIYKVKGIHTLIEAFNGLKDENAELLVYGKGSKAYLDEIRNMCYNNKVKFLGYFEELSEPFSNIDVLIVPSVWYETFSVVIREAFAAEIPVIASNVGAIPEIVNDEVNGLLFNKGDVGHLTKQIKKIIENPQLIEEYRRHMPEIKDMPSYVGDIEAIYENLISVELLNEEKIW